MELLLEALALIYSGRFGGVWNVGIMKEKEQ